MKLEKTRLALIAGLLAAAVPSAHGGDIGAAQSGFWGSTTTWTSGSVPGGGDDVYIGGNFPAGSAQSASVTLDGDASARTLSLGNGGNGQGTLNLGDFHLSLVGLTVGSSWGSTGSITRGTGSFSTKILWMPTGNSLTLGAGDQVGDLSLQGGSSLTTADSGNVSGEITVGAGSTLNLGADLVSSSFWGVGGQGVIDANGHSFTASSLGTGSGAITLLDRGDLHVGQLGLNGPLPDFQLTATDSVGWLQLKAGASTTLGAVVQIGDLSLDGGSSLTTSEAGNIIGEISVGAGSTLNLGADLVSSNFWGIGIDGTLDANGHDITARNLGFGGPSASLLEDAAITVNDLSLFEADISIDGLGDSSHLVRLFESSTLTLMQTLGDKTGFTLLGDSAKPLDSLQIDDTSILALIFADTKGESWLFRWQGSWTGVLDSMIADGRITVASTWGYDVVEREGYTYIMQTSAAVPEPASVVMMGVGLAGGLGLAARRRRPTTVA